MLFNKLPLETKARIRATLVSIILGSIILALKFWAYLLTNSTALKSDALEGVVNVVAAVFAFGAVIFAERPADPSHPYGHGKIEHFSAAFEGGLISLAAILILYEGVHSLIEGVHLQLMNIGLALNVAAGLLNGVLGWWLRGFGKKFQSKAIEADGHHVLSDFYTTLGLLAGLLLVKVTGITWLDPVLAIGVGLILAATGYKLVQSSSRALLDEEDPQLIENLVKMMNASRQPDVIGVHALRTMRSGRFTHIDIHVATPEFAPVSKVHDIVDRFADQVLKMMESEGEFHAHIDPCRRLYCENCAVDPCPIRRAAFQNLIPFTVAKAVSPDPV